MCRSASGHSMSILSTWQKKMSDAKQCPWCERWSLKDDQCNYVVCGRPEVGVFILGMGCGRAWCYECGGKLCGRMFCEETGELLDPNEDHNHIGNPDAQRACSAPGFCMGGHNSHKD
ncbi:MAG: hypothetical protein CL450_06645 [Acidimicrobiaceae bacterium]|nr:hypothetical protein [Acidimicrobiaceae bacterium]